MSALSDLQEMLDAATREAIPPPGPVGVSMRDLDPRLHAYQRVGVEHLLTNPRAGLFMEMGLGKTATVLQTIKSVNSDHLPVLVIAPKRVAEHVWPAEREIWRSELSLEVAAGTPAKRAKALASGADIVVIGRDNIKDVKPGQFRTIVLDELSGFKNRGSLRWKSARKLTDSAAYVWGLTGTPSPNGLMDLWAQIFLLDGGQRLGKTLTSFRQRFFRVGRQLPNGVVIEWVLRPGAAEEIIEKISDICLSMKSADYLDLPPVIHNEVRITLPPKTQKIYDTMVKDLVVEVGEQVHTSANPAVLSGKLSQISAGFMYADVEDRLVGVGETTFLDSAKIDALEEIISGTGSPVLVFHRFAEGEKERILQIFPQARYIDEPGVIEDWNSGEVEMLVAHPASAGHGLNLQKGGHIIAWTTMTWSPEEWEQANARLARQGQTHPVVVHRIVAESVDEAMFLRLTDKITVQDALMLALKMKEN